MGLVNLKLPLGTMERLIGVLTRCAVALERLAGPVPATPTYDSAPRRHVVDTDYNMIGRVDDLNLQRGRQGLGPLTYTEGAAHLRNDDGGIPTDHE